jgi:YD repeat-containing protein
MKIGYKATTNLKCINLQYEIGKTYSIDNIKICSHGFHYCDNMNDVLDYYKYNDKDFVLLELEILSDNIIKQGNKSVTDKIKVNRIIPKEEYTFELPVLEYDSNNNLIHCKHSNGYEYRQEYDSNNNLIHYENSKGFESWYDYDSNNNLIHYKNSKGFESWYDYDSNNNLIHYKNSKGFESWKEYDSNNNLIYYKNLYGYEYWHEYDSNNNLIHSKVSNGNEYWHVYDSNNNLIHSKDSNGYEWKITIE